MNSLDLDVLRTAQDWLDRGHRVVMGTVVRTWGSAPRPPGSLMIIRGDGQVAGSVSGGCIEDDLIARVARGELAPKLPQATVYGATAEEAQRFGLPCGGSVQLVLEPLCSSRSQLRELLAALAQHQRVRRRLVLATGVVALESDEAALAGDSVQFDGEQLLTLHGPAMRLLIVGGGQLSRLLAQFAVALDYRVTVCDPRPEYHEGWSQLEGVLLATGMPDDVALALHLDANSAVVALTHDPKLDDLALIEALRSPAFYVGALGSGRNNAARRQRLLEHFRLSDAELARLRGPVGLNLRALTPPEIALAIAAEMTARRRGADLAQLSDWSGSTTECLTG
ncbi:MAG: XdhC family protein [Burkholderiales bacterium]|nr:XdhC family protein [Burkholderiales bacterium]